MLRIVGLLAGFGLLVLLVKGIVFLLPLLAILFFFRLVMGGFGPFGAGRFHPAHAFGAHRHNYGPHRGPHRNHWQAERPADCYSYHSRYRQETPAERPAATGPTVRL